MWQEIVLSIFGSADFTAEISRPTENETGELTVVIVCGIPGVSPRVDRVLKSPSIRPGIDTVLDLECITQ